VGLVSIFLADDHEVVRNGIRELLQDYPDWTVCGESDNGRETVRLAIQLKPHIVIIDLCMPEMNGLEATRQIRSVCPETEVLIYSVQESEQWIRQSIEAGARAYILKTDPGKYLVEAIEALSRHEPFFTSRACQILLNTLLKSHRDLPLPALTGREREIIQMLAEGKANKEIAGTLCISVKTVETHRAAIKRKLSITSLAQLVRYAIRNHLVQP
jgi:DNA-binding NarL/FixJ family response regulator